MKKALKLLFITLISYITLLFLFSYVYAQSVRSNMEKYEQDVNSKWVECFDTSTEKVKSTKADVTKIKKCNAKKSSKAALKVASRISEKSMILENRKQKTFLQVMIFKSKKCFLLM